MILHLNYNCIDNDSVVALNEIFHRMASILMDYEFPTEDYITFPEKSFF